jgi:hypothetical protein
MGRPFAGIAVSIQVLREFERKLGSFWPIGFDAKQGPIIWDISQDRFRESPQLKLPKIVEAPIVPSKTAGPKNALAHCLYASDLVLAWENEQDFVDLHESIRQELNPVGVSKI